MKHEEKINKYINELKIYNENINIYSKKSYDKLPFHVKDCINLAEILKDEKSLIDLGSGSGLPSIILAILLKECKIIAIESKKKKTDFLNICKEKLQLTNLRIINKNIYEYIQKEKPRIDVITAKAFAPYPKILDISKGIKHKKIILPKSKMQCEEIREAYRDTRIIKKDTFYYLAKEN